MKKFPDNILVAEQNNIDFMGAAVSRDRELWGRKFAKWDKAKVIDYIWRGKFEFWCEGLSPYAHLCRKNFSLTNGGLGWEVVWLIAIQKFVDREIKFFHYSCLPSDFNISSSNQCSLKIPKWEKLKVKSNLKANVLIMWNAKENIFSWIRKLSLNPINVQTSQLVQLSSDGAVIIRSYPVQQKSSSDVIAINFVTFVKRNKTNFDPKYCLAWQSLFKLCKNYSTNCPSTIVNYFNSQVGEKTFYAEMESDLIQPAAELKKDS